MTSKERLTRLFEGRDIDRTPIWLLFPWHRLGCYTDVYNIPDYAPIIRRIEAGDVDSFDRRGADSGFCYNANPDIRVEHHGTDAVTIHAPGITLTKHVRMENGVKCVKFYVDDPADLTSILNIPYVPPRPPLGKLREERAEFGGRGLFMLDLGDALAPLYGLMSATDFSMATATDYDLLLEFLDEMNRRVLELYRYFLEADAVDCYFIVGAEFAGPPLVSPAKFSEMSVRYVKRICDLIRSYNKWSIVHYHGNLFRIREGMKQINPDSLHTVEAPPIGDCTIAEAREVLDPMVLIGNIQYDDLIRLDEEQIEAQVIEALSQARDGRFILSPTAGPYEDRLPACAVNNYMKMIDTGLQYGKY